MINIASSVYNLEHKALEVYVSGCTRHCMGCHNRELWEFDKGYDILEWLKIKDEFFKKDQMIKQFWILGGDLLCQKSLSESAYFLKSLSEYGKTIWLWTGADMKEVLDFLRQYKLTCVKYVKTGQFIRTDSSIVYHPDKREDTASVELASWNQILYRKDDDADYVFTMLPFSFKSGNADGLEKDG